MSFAVGGSILESVVDVVWKEKDDGIRQISQMPKSRAFEERKERLTEMLRSKHAKRKLISKYLQTKMEIYNNSTGSANSSTLRKAIINSKHTIFMN